MCEVVPKHNSGLFVIPSLVPGFLLGLTGPAAHGGDAFACVLPLVTGPVQAQAPKKKGADGALGRRCRRASNQADGGT
jgi:hypothetical protein